jgi:hypothetical protein
MRGKGIPPHLAVLPITVAHPAETVCADSVTASINGGVKNLRFGAGRCDDHPANSHNTGRAHPNWAAAGSDRDSLAAVPRSVDFSVESSASVEQIHSAFCEEEYWLARLAAFGGFGKLNSLLIGTDGSVAVVIIHDLRHDGLPGLVAKFFPRGWQVVQNETWSPIGGGLVRGEISIATHGAPGSGRGKALLGPAHNGSCLKCTATVEFKVPLVGGKIESLMGRLLVQQISVIQQFTAKWITDNA